MKKLVIFDMDGTLVNNIPFHLKSWISFFKSKNIDVDPDEFLATNHGTVADTITKYMGPMESSEAFLIGEEKEEVYRNMYRPHVTPLPGLMEFIEYLKSTSISMSLATMAGNENIQFLMSELKIRAFLDLILSGTDVAKGKPDPEVFTRTLDYFSLNSDDALVFEDSQGGVNAALGAGIDVVGVTTTLNSQEMLDMGCMATISNYLEFDRAILTT